MSHHVHDDDEKGLLITATSANKRSLTEQLVNYVKKSKCFVPCAIASPAKASLLDDDTRPVCRRAAREPQAKRGKSLDRTVFIHSLIHSFQVQYVLPIQFRAMITPLIRSWHCTVRTVVCSVYPSIKISRWTGDGFVFREWIEQRKPCAHCCLFPFASLLL